MSHEKITVNMNVDKPETKDDPPELHRPIEELYTRGNTHLEKIFEYLKQQYAEKPISQVCRETHFQLCHLCDDESCGDNTNQFLKTKIGE